MYQQESPAACVPDGAMVPMLFADRKVHEEWTVMHNGPGLQQELSNITGLRANRKRLKAEGSQTLVSWRLKVQPGAFFGVFTQQALWDDGAESGGASQRA